MEMSPLLFLPSGGSDHRWCGEGCICNQRSFLLPIFTGQITTSATPTMAGSLQVAAQTQTQPHPTNTIMDASATSSNVGVGGVDSATTAVTNSAEATRK